MAEPYLGEIRMFAGNFAPAGWALCNGQLLSIAENTALFSIVGTFYGGNGVNTFGLPDLRSRVAIHQGQGAGLSPYVVGQSSGVENVTLNVNQIPAHSHTVNASASKATQPSPIGHYPATDAAGVTAEYGVSPTGVMNAGMISPTGSGQPFTNIQPYLCVTFIIALEGIYPSRN
jgi:microcystin-dependent protein